MKRWIICCLLAAMLATAGLAEALPPTDAPGAEEIFTAAVDPDVDEAGELPLGDEAEADEAPAPEEANGEIEVSNWEQLVSAVKNARDGDTIKICGRIHQENNNSLSIKGKAVALTGSELWGNKKKKCIVISSGGGLTLFMGPKIEYSASAVTVGNGCAFTMSGGSLSDNTLAVDNSGAFTMTHGTISGSKQAVQNSGSFTMTGGFITGNKKGVLTYFSDTALTVSGHVNITGNTEYDVLVKSGQVVAVGGELNAKTRIGITLSSDNLPPAGGAVVVTRGLSGNGTADNFVVWGDYVKRINGDGELEITLPPPDDPAAPDMTLLAKLTAPKEGTLRLAWTTVDGADGYDVFFAPRDEKVKRIATVTGARSYLIKGLKKGAIYKGRARAWKKVDGKKKIIGASSPMVYAIAGGSTKKLCNPESVALKRTRMTIAEGKTAAISAGVTGVRSDREVLQICQALRYFSTDRNVATVSRYGKVTAVSAGTCNIYVMANNGVRKRVTITVEP